MSQRERVPMTAAELMAFLAQLPPETPVFREAFDFQRCRNTLHPVEGATYWPDEGEIIGDEPAGAWLA